MEVLDSALVSKDAPVDPTSACELLKRVEGEHIETYAELYCIDIVGLRYFSVYGIGQTGGGYSGVVLICFDWAKVINRHCPRWRRSDERSYLCK